MSNLVVVTGRKAPGTGLAPFGRVRDYVSGSRLLGGRSEDQEFLPAHLEILQTPPAPLRVAAIWLLCGILTAVLLWSCFARLDIYAAAAGRIQPSGRSKVVQPLDTGTVREILVENGSTVKRGDVLLKLDSTVAKAEREAVLHDLESLQGEIPRRQAEIKAVMGKETAVPTVAFPDTVGAGIRLREEGVLGAELAQYLASRATTQAKLGENIALKERLSGSVAARESVVDVLRERLGMKQELLVKAAGTKAAFLDAKQGLGAELTSLAFDKGQLIEAEAANISLNRSLDQLQKQFLSDQAVKLTDAERKKDQVIQNLVKANFKLDSTTLKASIDGTVQQLSVTTIGQVITAGQPVMVIVPSGGSMEIEALVQNSDVGFVDVGQEAVIKLNAFPFTRYGTIEGHVKRVSRDAVDAKDAAQSSDAATASRDQNASTLSTTPNAQNLVFPITVEMGKTSISVDGHEVTLTPGMTVSVEIRTGTRRVIDYLFSPLREASSGAGHER